MDDKLTVEALEKMLMQMVEHIGEKVSLIPKRVMYRPAELEALGYTHEDIVKLIEKAKEPS